MTIDDKIKDQNFLNDINREATKRSAISSGKIDKYKSHRGEEIIPSSRSQMIEQTKFMYFLLGKFLEKQKRRIDHQGEKQIKANEKSNALNTTKYNNMIILVKIIVQIL